MLTHATAGFKAEPESSSSNYPPAQQGRHASPRRIVHSNAEDAGCRNMEGGLRYSQAGVAEWQTRRTQNPLVARPCGFDSLLRHQLSIGLNLYPRRYCLLSRLALDSRYYGP
jgi:hypothetical protein